MSPLGFPVKVSYYVFPLMTCYAALIDNYLVTNYQSMLRNMLEERRPTLHSGRSLKAFKFLYFPVHVPHYV
jgi:hypothetical protein